MNLKAPNSEFGIAHLRERTRAPGQVYALTPEGCYGSLPPIPITRRDTVRPARFAGQGQGIQLAACSEWTIPDVLALFFWPKPEALDGNWKQPPLQCLK
jgi:hypothetical protein